MVIVANRRGRYLPVMSRVHKCLGMIAAGFLCAAVAASAARADTLDSMKKTYSAINTVEARFEQTILLSALKRTREAKGEFYYKRDRGFLWKYTSPKEKTFLYDGTAVWQEEEDNPVVIRQKMDKARMEGSLIMDLVEDVTRLDQLFIVKASTRENGMEVLQLVPKKEGTMQSARIWVDSQSLIKRLEVIEITGNVNTIEFSSIRTNKLLADTLFVFKAGGKQIEEQ